jgi:holo-[acyl-carrier protein] synthase
MVIATGIDIIEIARIEEAFSRRGSRFRDRVFTKNEIAYCEGRESKYASYAARFAAKEAAFKALGTGWSEGIGWRDVEVARADSGKPSLNLSGRALIRFKELGGRQAHLSLSHSKELAMAQVLFES